MGSVEWGMVVEILTDSLFLKRIVPGNLGNYHSQFPIPHYFNKFLFISLAEWQRLPQIYQIFQPQSTQIDFGLQN